MLVTLAVSYLDMVQNLEGEAEQGEGLLDLPMEPNRTLVISRGCLPRDTGGSGKQHGCTTGIRQRDKVGFEGT
ncbi:hypothetical protein DUI87_25507 [Hirundo rustica rustica]|uniref:Uncharacterized protein n=1 Tax=Hirundo rustica rustica TaxID=333673 RepID=A0A3M0JH27_HIRRU|nr:hypothetical protein DUI87_25507 [Hirundo rustica rustica]